MPESAPVKALLAVTAIGGPTKFTSLLTKVPAGAKLTASEPKTPESCPPVRVAVVVLS